jgi:hypothetical protein
VADTSEAPGALRYWAFISYSHRDEKWASWLHKKIETYTGHKKLVGSLNRLGEPVPSRMFPVFRDRDELEGAPDLPNRINEALQQSRFLIVVCSPDSARSKWVDEEIRTFKAWGRDDRVLALIVDGEPNVTGAASAGAVECFPAALRHRVGGDRELTPSPPNPSPPIFATARTARATACSRSSPGFSASASMSYVSATRSGVAGA